MGTSERPGQTATTIPFVTSGAYPVRAGNRVRPLIDGEAAFRRICEAVEAAQRSVWVTVTFLWDSFEMPDGRGSFFDVLDRTAARGVDVRVIFWRHDAETASLGTNAFWGSREQVAFLEARRSGLSIRWDRAHPGWCQHQKSWLIDGGGDGATAFVGGINQNPHSMVAPGHRGEGHNHDLYVEVAGPATVDVHHNFVQRWNGASERDIEGGSWGREASRELPYPDGEPADRGGALVQIQRTIRRGRYQGDHATVGGEPYDIAGGERSIFEQYRAAIGAARSSIYIENQFLEVAEIVADLHAALDRGVDVVVVVPGDPDPTVARAASRPDRARFVAERARLGTHDRFTLAGLAGPGTDPGDGRRAVYVHAKIMLIDDQWATIGSANLHERSQFGHGEMNATFRDIAVVRVLRCALLAEHLGEDTTSLDDRSALRRFREVADDNRRRRAAGEHVWSGLAYTLEPDTYGR